MKAGMDQLFPTEQFTAHGWCCKCGRELSNPVSVQAGIGPICAGKVRTDRHDLPFDLVAGDVVCERHLDGTLHFNIPVKYTHHSPSGWEWGYGGSGPADFALNILAAFIDPSKLDKRDTVEAWQGVKIPAAIWHMHQEFKWATVARMPREGGIIPGHAIRAWLMARGPWPAGAIR